VSYFNFIFSVINFGTDACHDDFLDSFSLFSISKILQTFDIKRMASFENDEYLILMVVGMIPSSISGFFLLIIL